MHESLPAPDSEESMRRAWKIYWQLHKLLQAQLPLIIAVEVQKPTLPKPLRLEGPLWGVITDTDDPLTPFAEVAYWRHASSVDLGSPSEQAGTRDFGWALSCIDAKAEQGSTEMQLRAEYDYDHDFALRLNLVTHPVRGIVIPHASVATSEQSD